MGRKKKSQLEQTPADLQSVEWINTPFSLVQFGKGFSLIQQQALIKVSKYLQKYISDFYNEHRNAKPDRPLALFTKEALEKGIKIPLRADEFNIQSSNYTAVFEAFQTISLTQVRAPKFDEQGNRLGTDWYNVFSHFYMPLTQAGYVKDRGLPTEERFARYEGYAEFTVNPNIAAYAFDMTSGYINHPAEIAMQAQQPYAPLLYFLIKHSSKGKRVVEVPYRDVQIMLGTVTVDREDNDKIIENSFPLFSKFKQRVLDVAQTEIERMASLNQIDITFTYRPIYMGKTQRGDPKSIEFSIMQTELGVYHAKHKTRQQKTNDAGSKKIEKAETLSMPVEPSPEVLPFGMVDEWQQLLEAVSAAALPVLTYLQRARYYGLHGKAPMVIFSDIVSREEYERVLYNMSDAQRDELKAIVRRFYPDGERGVIMTSIEKK